MVPKRCLQRPAVAGLSADMAIVAGQRCGGAGVADASWAPHRRARRAGAALALQLAPMGFTTGVILEVVEQEDHLAAAVVAALALAAARGDGAVVGQGTAADPWSSTAHGAPSSSRNEPASAAGSPNPAELCDCKRLVARSGTRANQMCCAHCPSSHSDTCQRRERRRLKNAPPPPPPPSQPRG